MSGAVLGIGDTVCKSNDELKLERNKSPDFYVSMTSHSRDLWCTCAHIFQKRQLGKLFGTRMLNRAYAVFINQRTNGPVNAHLISSPNKARNIQNLENI